MRAVGLNDGTDFRPFEATTLDVNQLDNDLKSILVDKAGGTVHTRVLNSMHKGGVYAYADVYRHSTET